MTIRSLLVKTAGVLLARERQKAAILRDIRACADATGRW